MERVRDFDVDLRSILKIILSHFDYFRKTENVREINIKVTTECSDKLVTNKNRKKKLY